MSDADLAAYARSTFGQRGSRLAARAFSMVDGRSQSRPESVLRVGLVSAGLPKPVVQLAIVLPNGVTLHPDLAWEEYRVAAEYDGLWHGDADQFHRDRRRLNLLVASGWLVLHVTSQRMRTDFPGVVREIRAALESRGWQAKIAQISMNRPRPRGSGRNFHEVARSESGQGGDFLEVAVIKGADRAAAYAAARAVK